jgi:hypothetical protein
MFQTPNQIYVYDGISICILLFWLTNRNSMRAASCLVFKTIYDLCKQSETLRFLFYV